MQPDQDEVVFLERMMRLADRAFDRALVRRDPSAGDRIAAWQMLAARQDAISPASLGGARIKLRDASRLAREAGATGSATQIARIAKKLCAGGLSPPDVVALRRSVALLATVDARAARSAGQALAWLATPRAVK